MDEKIAAIEDAVFVGVSVADRKVLRQALQSVRTRGHADGTYS